ncbi:hypothetical protein DL93DRAFT_806079 [Clavulina sp. PMI_390]|nr:hypothetical protein DL93DRAFT_806079 [Clavulina sp. PMI_390]
MERTMTNKLIAASNLLARIESNGPDVVRKPISKMNVFRDTKAMQRQFGSLKFKHPDELLRIQLGALGIHGCIISELRWWANGPLRFVAHRHRHLQPPRDSHIVFHNEGEVEYGRITQIIAVQMENKADSIQVVMRAEIWPKLPGNVWDPYSRWPDVAGRLYLAGGPRASVLLSTDALKCHAAFRECHELVIPAGNPVVHFIPLNKVRSHFGSQRFYVHSS